MHNAHVCVRKRGVCACVWKCVHMGGGGDVRVCHACMYWCVGRRNVLNLVSHPGLLTPVFVDCSTNAGEGRVKLVTCSDMCGCDKNDSSSQIW